MTAATEAMTALLERLRALEAAATKGPFDVGPCNIIRAIRDDLAVPIFEPRPIFHDPAMPAPTVRRADGSVQFRAKSEGASISQHFKLEHANSALVVALLNALPDLLAHIEAQAREIEGLRNALEPFSELGRLLSGKFEEVLFQDDQPIKDLPWSENGKCFTILYSDLRKARAALNPTPKEEMK